MKKTLFLLLFLAASAAVAFNVYPLVNWINVRPGDELEYKIQITGGKREERVEIELHDFAIIGKKYVYDLPDYEYSFKNYIELPSTSLVLKPGEVVEFPIKIKVPRDFKGAQGFASIAFLSEPIQHGQIELRMRVVTLFIFNVENRRVMDVSLEGYNVMSMSSPNVPDMYKIKYGDFGTLLQIKLKNIGNMVFALKGEARIISRKYGRIIASVPVSNTEFVLFPDFEGTLTLYTPSVLPAGDLILQLEGVSQEVRVAKAFKIESPGSEFKTKVVGIQPDYMFFTTEKPINAKFRVQNLAEWKTQVKVEIDSPLKVYPKKAFLPPFSGMNFFLVFDPRRANLPKGDNIYKIKVSSATDENVNVVGKGIVIIRNGAVQPSFDVKIDKVEDKKVKLVIKNTGKMTIEFMTIEKTALKTNALSGLLLLIPGESGTLEFTYTIDEEMAKNAVLLRYRIYKTEEWHEMKLPWKE